MDEGDEWISKGSGGQPTGTSKPGKAAAVIKSSGKSDKDRKAVEDVAKEAAKKEAAKKEAAKKETAKKKTGGR